MDLCLGWIRHRSLLHLPHWTHRSPISHWFPRCQPFLLRYLGSSLACLQSLCNGLCLVWSAIMDWYAAHFLKFTRHRLTSIFRWAMCHSHDLCHLASVQQPPQLDARELGNKHERLCVLLLVLALLSACHLPTCSSNQTSIHGQGFRRPYRRYCLLHLVPCPGQGHWTNCQTAFKGSRKCSCMGNG